MTFRSILYSNGSPPLQKEAPGYFYDLRIDKIIQMVLSGMEEYNLDTFFYTPPDNIRDVQYRQDILRDLENAFSYTAVRDFTASMHSLRAILKQSGECEYNYEKKTWFLETAGIYCNAVALLEHTLLNADIKSPGMQGFRDYISGYVHANDFVTLTAETRNLIHDFSLVRYSVLFNELQVQVLEYKPDNDFSQEISATFKKFREDPGKDYHAKFDKQLLMNRVEARILDGVVSLYPELFHRLDIFCEQHANYTDPVIADFDREVHVYTSWREHTEYIKKTGLSFCFPEILTDTRNISNTSGFDLALANLLQDKNQPVVCNDFYLNDNERTIIVSGPNQGGKTTFARAFGQLHYLAAMGLTVPGTSAKLFLCDTIFTHFEKEEDVNSYKSKFEDDLIRIRNILAKATSRSIVIFNEILSSTSLQDVLLLSKKIISRVDALNCICIWVTFMDDLVAFSSKTVSMVSAVDAANPAIRTFKVIRKAADGLAYALSVAEKYQLTYSQLKKRISR